MCLGFQVANSLKCLPIQVNISCIVVLPVLVRGARVDVPPDKAARSRELLCILTVVGDSSCLQLVWLLRCGEFCDWVVVVCGGVLKAQSYFDGARGSSEASHRGVCARC